ncbi:MAG: hypothetical protein ACRCVH_12080, partial [Vagococcus fluvialis]
MRNEKVIKEAKLDENAWFDVKVGQLRAVGVTDEQIWELVKNKPMSLDGCNSDDLLQPFLGYLTEDLEEESDDYYDILEEEVGHLIDELKFSEISGLGSNSYMFEAFTDAAREDTCSDPPLRLKELKELIMLIYEALVES